MDLWYLLILSWLISFLIINKLKSKLFNPFEALVEVVLNSQRILGLTQNMQQVIVWKEEETRERQSLSVKVIVQTFLNAVDLVIALLEMLK